MKVWHNKNDAPRLPDKIRSGQKVELWIGTYPIEPGQHVKVEWRATQQDSRTQSGTLPAFWKYNDFAAGNTVEVSGERIGYKGLERMPE